MNKKALIAVIAIIILISAAIAYVLLTPSNPTSPSKTSTDSQQEQPSQETPSITTPANPGVYVEYSEETVLATTNTKILFFHAPWCPQCRAIEESIKKDGIPDGVTVFKVDYDSNQALRQKYGVTLQTTFVKIDDKGDKVESYVAYKEPDFASVKRELLP